MTFSWNNVYGWEDVLLQASEAGGARPWRRSLTIAAAEMTFGPSTGLRADGKVGAKLARSESTRKTAKIAWPGSEGAEIPVTGTIRENLLSSIAISWSCRSSVMEMTKNKMTRAHPIATIFCQFPEGRSGQVSVPDRLLQSNPIPTIATHAQTRLSASSMVSNVSYATHRSGATTFGPDWPIH